MSLLSNSFSSRFLQNEIRRTVIGMFVVLVLSYSAALGYYFAAGLSIASNVSFETIAELYQQDIEKEDVSARTPPAKFSSNDQYEDLPEHVQRLFPLETIVAGVPQIKFNTSATDESAHLVFLLAEQLPNGKTVFLTRELSAEGRQLNNHSISLDFLEHTIFWGGAGILLLVFLITQLMVRRINRHIHALQTWAETLEISEAGKPLPEFRYEELKQIADRFASSVRRVGAFVDREQHFLRHASHELRTPIATMSGNVSLLNKLHLSEKQAPVVDRIARACLSMQTIVTTLLWLGREVHATPDSESVNLKEMLDRTIEDHRYLLEGKDIRIKNCTSDSVAILPSAPLGIVVANLVRNAFQHTQTGEIEFSVASETIEIRNRTGPMNLPQTEFDAEGGIGLSLVRRIVKRLGWRLELTPSKDSVTAVLSFGPACPDDLDQQSLLVD